MKVSSNSLTLRWSFLSAILLFVFTLPASAQIPLGKSEYQKLHKELQSSDTEPWRTIPWQTSLLEAQNIAAKENKPIFIWAMDGHPLGCT